MLRAKVFWIRLAVIGLSILAVSATAQNPKTSQIGREVAILRHLQDDEEFSIPIKDLIDYGKNLFMANWTDQEGAGRPLTKGNGIGLADPSQPLVGARGWNRISGPDANSCYGCHNMPYGIPGGGR